MQLTSEITFYLTAVSSREFLIAPNAEFTLKSGIGQECEQDLPGAERAYVWAPGDQERPVLGWNDLECSALGLPGAFHAASHLISVITLLGQRY